MKIYLRDRNKNLVDWWTTYFKGVSAVDPTCGDVFEDFSGMPIDAIVSPANSFGFMDGGIDLVYTEKFGPEIGSKLRDVIEKRYDGELMVGQAVCISTNEVDCPYMISAPTMRIPMDIRETVNAYLAFKAVLRLVTKLNSEGLVNINTIVCPGLGTGIGHLSSEVCAKQMRLAYGEVIEGRKPLFNGLGQAMRYHGGMIMSGDFPKPAF